MRTFAFLAAAALLCGNHSLSLAEVIPAPCGEDIPCEEATVKNTAEPEIIDLSYEELRALLDAGSDFLLLDTRPVESCKGGHIPKAECFPLSDINPVSVEKLPKSKLIVVYCQSASCHVSHAAAVQLKRYGFDVKDYKGGVFEWTAKGHTLDQDTTDTLPVSP